MTDNKKYLYLNYYYFKDNGHAQMLYYLATMVVVTKLILAYSEIFVMPDFLNSVLNYTFILLMLLKVISNFNFKLKKIYIAFIVFATLALYTSIQTDNYGILFSALGVLGIKGMSVRSIIRISFKVKVFWLTLHFVCFIFAMSFFPQTVEYSLIGGEIRHRIYLSQPNTCAMLFLWMFFEYIYLNYEKLYFRKFLTCTLLYGIILYITKSKTSGIVYALLWLMIFLKNNKVLQKIILVLSKYGFVILSIFFAFTTVMYSKLPSARILNTMLTGRLAGAAEAYEWYGFTIFGQYLDLGTTIDWDPFYGVTSIWLENTYTMLFINYGIIYAALIAIALWYVAEYLTDKDKIFVCAMLIYGISESYIVNIFLCFPLLVVAGAIFDKRKYLMANYDIDAS